MKEFSLTSKVDFKVIQAERFEDAPFVAALISACDCRFNCANCFNQHLKKAPTQRRSIKEIIDKIKSNPFHKGVVFAGLEWSLQESELISLVLAANNAGLQTMVYTGYDFSADFVRRLIANTPVDYIKCGRYREDLRTANHIEYGVVLSSRNQHIYKKGVDY